MNKARLARPVAGVVEGLVLQLRGPLLDFDLELVAKGEMVEKDKELTHGHRRDHRHEGDLCHEVERMVDIDLPGRHGDDTEEGKVRPDEGPQSRRARSLTAGDRVSPRPQGAEGDEEVAEHPSEVGGAADAVAVECHQVGIGAVGDGTGDQAR